MIKPISILLLDFDPLGGLGDTLRKILASVPRWVVQLEQVALPKDESTPTSQRQISSVMRCNPDVAILVLSRHFLPQAQRLLSPLKRYSADIPLLAVVEACEPDELFNLLKLGVADFIVPPLQSPDIIPRVRRSLEQAQRRLELAHTLKEKFGLKQLIGQSEIFRAAVQKIPVVAQCDASVLISGETGTGKELCARAIHYLSPRASHAFVPVNCGAIPTDLVENELFGHEPGAFTHALTAKSGLIREASGGTLFLDEIDCLPLLAQVKLLRFLQEKEYRPLGSTKTKRADVRVIAAANTDFDEAVRMGRLRRDLYYRLNVIPLPLPPLRERAEDIPLLARHFLTKYTTEFHKPEIRLAAEAIRRLTLYEWPGNVRELEHVIERVVALAEQEVIQGDDPNLPYQPIVMRKKTFREAKTQTIAEFERAYIQELLLTYHGNINQAAKAAQKNRRAFWELIRKYHIDAQSFKPVTPSR
jgi:two-component system, NtrC family, response regulator GlrR